MGPISTIIGEEWWERGRENVDLGHGPPREEGSRALVDLRNQHTLGSQPDVLHSEKYHPATVREGILFYETNIKELSTR